MDLAGCPLDFKSSGDSKIPSTPKAFLRATPLVSLGGQGSTRVPCVALPLGRWLLARFVWLWFCLASVWLGGGHGWNSKAMAPGMAGMAITPWLW